MLDIQRMVNPPVTNQAVDPIRLAFLQWLTAGDEADQALVGQYRDYYDGRHHTQLTSRMRSFLELAANVEFNMNFMPIPVDILKERMAVKGFDAADPQGGDEGMLWEWWKANRMDGVQKAVHLSTFRDGASFVIVGWDNERGTPTFDHNLVYDGTSGVKVFYREEDRRSIDFAAKLWRVEGEDRTQAGHVRRLNIYTPDAIYKYQSDGRDGVGGAWVPMVEHDESGAEMPWPVPWVDGSGMPLGVPVIHFRNNAGGYNDGKSELHDLIPLQNALNKAVIDELASADVEGFGLITKTGGGDPSSMTVAPRSIAWDPDPASQWGNIAPSDLAGLRGLVKEYIMRVAQISRTPLSYFQVTGQVASSETQRADDSGLISKAEDRSIDLGNSWEDVMLMARRLHNTFGEGSLGEDVAISTIWGSFERVDKLETEKKRSQVALNLVNAGASPSGAFKAAGYSDEQVTEMVGGRMLPQDEV